MTFSNNVVSILPMLTKKHVRTRKADSQNAMRMPKEAEPLTADEIAVARRLSARFDELNKENGLTQHTLGRSIKTRRQPRGISQTMISQYLGGTKHMGVEVFLRLCKALGIPPAIANPKFEFIDMIPGDLSGEAFLDAAAIENMNPTKRDGVRKLIRPE